jgi:hypothetical protein
LNPGAPAPAVPDELPPRPQPPGEEDCCHSGCPVCVFDHYERELERWEERAAEILRRRGAGPGTPPGRGAA